jgi:hypothetical protein
MEKQCSCESPDCFGEIKSYQYRWGSAEEISAEDEAYRSGKSPYPLGGWFLNDFCEFHKKGEIFIKKPMRPSLPYQGIARRILKE